MSDLISTSSEPVCYLSLETVFNTFHSVLPVAEMAVARLAHVDGELLTCVQEVKAKRTPQLVPYGLLEEQSKGAGRDSAREAVCTLLAYGYSLEPLALEPGTSSSSPLRPRHSPPLSPQAPDEACLDRADHSRHGSRDGSKYNLNSLNISG